MTEAQAQMAVAVTATAGVIDEKETELNQSLQRNAMAWLFSVFDIRSSLG